MKWGGLDVILEPEDGKGDGPIVVLMHGFGAPGDDLVSLGAALNVPGARFVFPAAPIELPAMGWGDARAWWLIDMRRMEQARARRDEKHFAEYVPAMHQAREQIEQLVADVQRALGPAPLVVGGFSQGSMLAVDLAVHAARPPEKLVILSGALADAKGWKFEAMKGTKVFQSHGRQDPLLPFDGAVALRDRMTAAGLDVHWIEFEGGHEIPRNVLVGLRAFLRA